MKHITVVAAVIQKDKKTLCVQRNSNKYDYISYKYEFPGGKVEPDESLEQALIREIKEELDLDILINRFLITVEHEYPDFRLTMHTFLCASEDGLPKLHEHIDYKWLFDDQLIELDWAAADIPIVKKLLENKHD